MRIKVINNYKRVVNNIIIYYICIEGFNNPFMTIDKYIYNDIIKTKYLDTEKYIF